LCYGELTKKPFNQINAQCDVAQKIGDCCVPWLRSKHAYQSLATGFERSEGVKKKGDMAGAIEPVGRVFICVVLYAEEEMA